MTKSSYFRALQYHKWMGLLVVWYESTNMWEQMSEIKDSYPSEVAKYANGNRIIDSHAFVWWAPFILKKLKIILSQLKEKHWKWNHKFRVEVTKYIAQARALDAKNGNTL